MSQPFQLTRRSAYHSWVPQTNVTHNAWVKERLDRARKHKASKQAHKTAVQTFANRVTADQRKLFDRALRQVQQYYSDWADPDSIIADFSDFLYLLDDIVEASPQFYKANIGGETIGEPIGVPLYLIMDLLSNTSAAYTLFTQESFNTALKDLLNSWGKYLTTAASNSTLTSWFSPEGMAVLQSGLGNLTFDQTYVTELQPPTRYRSWDSFFTRQLKAGVRPVVTDPNRFFIYNACECTVLRTASNVQLHDTFWLKSQNYSLYDALGGDDPNSLAPDFAERLVGGSIYQAFLSPQDYHRWHSPIKGRVVKRHVFPGTYYAVLPDSGAPEYDPDLEPGDPHGALIRSQPWLSVAATRAAFIIEPTERSSPIDLVAFIAIGMAEVSTCDPTVAEGASVNVGQQLGTFHFGGSSHTLIVKPKRGYNIMFQDFYNTPIRPGQHRWVNSVIAQVRGVGR